MNVNTLINYLIKFKEGHPPEAGTTEISHLKLFRGEDRMIISLEEYIKPLNRPIVVKHKSGKTTNIILEPLEPENYNAKLEGCGEFTGIIDNEA